MCVNVYIYIYMVPPPPPVPRLCPVQVRRLVPNICLCSLVVAHLWESKVSFTMAPEASEFSVCNPVAPEISPSSWNVLEMLVKQTFSMICLWGIMEIVGFTSNSNNFHTSRNYGLGPRGFSKFMEIVVCGESWQLLVLPTFPTISMIPETMAQAPEVSPDSWELLKTLVSPTVSAGTYFKTVLPQVAIEQILCTRARCFADKAGKVFASLIKVTCWSNRRLKTLLWERQFMGLLFITYKAILHVYISRLYYRKATAARAFLCWLNHTHTHTHTQNKCIGDLLMLLGVCIGGF